MSIVDLRNLAGNQFGLFTTAQANQLGVSRTKLHTLVQNSEIRTVRRGVYAFEIFTPNVYEELRAAWLSLDPNKTVAERLHDDQCAVIATTSASHLHGLGNFTTYSHEFFTPIRKQSRAQDILLKTRALPPSDVEIVEGMKVTSVTRTALDLLADGVELEHISDFLTDAAYEHKVIDWKRIQEESSNYRKLYGLPAKAIFLRILSASHANDVRFAQAVVEQLSPDFSELISKLWLQKFTELKELEQTTIEAESFTKDSALIPKDENFSSLDIAFPLVNAPLDSEANTAKYLQEMIARQEQLTHQIEQLTQALHKGSSEQKIFQEGTR